MERGRGEERELERSSASRPSGPGILMTLKQLGEEGGREGERERGREGGRGEERELERSPASRPSEPGIQMTLKQLGEEAGRERGKKGQRRE